MDAEKNSTDKYKNKTTFLFDLYGTLINSEKAFYRSFKKL